MNSEQMITKQLLKSKSGEFDVESIHTLNLKSMGIDDLGCMGECSALERLDLSNNDVSNLYSLAGLTNLSYLNLSANKISYLEGLQSLDSLITLNIAGNLIGSIETLHCISTLEKLTELRLKDDIHELTNPICMNTSYKKDVLAILPNLVTLDGERLTGKGSELFQLCNDLDNIIKVQEKSSSLGMVTGRRGQWLPPDMWTPQPTEFDSSNLVDSEEQLEALLAACKKVTEEADVKINSLVHRGTENSQTDAVS